MRGQPKIFRDFSGGVNALDAPYALNENQCRDVRNCVTTNRGALRKRDGSQILATLPAVATSLFASVAPRVLLAASGTAVYAINSAKAVTTLSTALSNAQWEWANMPANGGQGPIYGSNGFEARYYDGTTFAPWTATAGTLPLARYFQVAGNHLFAAGMSSYTTVADPGSALVWSNIGNARDWPAANIALFDPGDGEAITGLGTVGPYLLVFKPSKAWIVYDLDTGANRRLGTNVGAVSNRSIVETPQGTVFLSKDQGLMLTTGQSARRVSDPVLPLLQAIPPAQRANAAGVFHMQHYYLAISQGAGFNDLLLDYDLKAESWWLHTLPENDMAVWDIGTGPILVGAKGSAATVRQLFVANQTQDDIPAAGGAGTNVSGYWSGPFLTFDGPEVRKRCRQIRFDGKGRVQVSVAKDFARNAALITEALFSQDTSGLYGINDGSLFGVNDGGFYGGTIDIGAARVFTPGVARAFSVVLGNTTSETFEVDSYTMLMQPRKD